MSQFVWKYEYVLFVIVTLVNICVCDIIEISNPNQFGVPFNYSISIDTDLELFTLTMIGPVNSWMSIGLGNTIMDGTRSIVYLFDTTSNAWIVCERVLGHHNDGIKIKQLYNYSENIIDYQTHLQITLSYNQGLYSYINLYNMK